MEWIRTHPYLVALIAAGLLVVSGAWVVTRRSAVTPASDTSTWGGGGYIFNTTSPSAPTNTANQPAPSTATGVTVPIPTPEAQPAGVPVPASADSFDYTAFLAALVRPQASSSTTKTSTPDAQVLQAYSYIPTGLISTTTPSKTRSAEQQALYDYGNDAGAIIKNYDRVHADQYRVLFDQLADPYNPDKIAGVVAIADDLTGVGKQLGAISSVPPSAEATNTALAQAYKTLGQKLALVPKNPNGDELINAIVDYDNSVEAFGKKYVALVMLFKAYGVSFSPEDAGSVFTFSQGAGL